MSATLIAIISVAIGFVCIGAAFVSFMYRKSPVLIGVLLVAALILVTVIPVFLAVAFGTTAG